MEFNLLEEKMINILKDLKENYHLIGIKSEPSAEKMSFESVLRLKELSNISGLDLTIKIGGCEALRDVYETRNLNAAAIVAPMIESVYSAKKFIKTVQAVFPQNKIRKYINIETQTGVQCLEDILESAISENIDGIVFGRTDMCASLGLTCADVNNDIILEIAEQTALISRKNNKDFIIGGSVSSKSIPFFKNISKIGLSGFETRKLIFDTKNGFENNISEGIEKAIEFELMLIENKKNYGETISPEDIKRIEILNRRCVKTINI